MSQTPPMAAPSSSSNFQSILVAALEDYKNKTKNDLLQHGLKDQLECCESASAILDALDKQFHIQQFIQSQVGCKSLKQWLSATATVLYAFSSALGQGIGLAFSPAKIIFAGIGVLFIAVRDVNASGDVLIGLFSRIENCFKRFEIYAQARLPDSMREFMVKMMVEVFGILATATKAIKQRWIKKYLKTLIGRTDIEDALKKLEKLSSDEGLMATAQILKVAHGVDDQVMVITERVNQVVHVGRETAEAVLRIEDHLGGLSRYQARKELQQWLDPPDPSINYNLARDIHHDGTATWFTRGETFDRWKSSSSKSSLWIHGKAGSGKSILSSSIIQETKHLSNDKESYTIFFFFDFRDEAKQTSRALLSSFVAQLCDQSDSFFKNIFGLYSAEGSAKQQPSEDTLLKCLKDVISGSGQVPIYITIDALDECPNISKEIGVPPPRRKALQIVKELVELHCPNLHLCVASRPEADIQSVLEPLAYFKVSLHDQDGQKEDISEYVRSVIYSDEEQEMKRWRPEIKELAFKTLSEKADGMFRWVACQLEVLRKCLARNVERVLGELPKSLDETYMRLLEGIDEANRDDVHRLLQCLVVAIRPLTVEELAEILAIDFEDGEGIPMLKPDWRWEDQGRGLQAACSSLITIIDDSSSAITDDGSSRSLQSRVVQFSHFSVKEFLTSPRLACSSRDVSRYHISLEPAH
ncbi:hypothetical protein BGW80DRAFT_1558544, partial [Lactifluus volemus]